MALAAVPLPHRDWPAPEPAFVQILAELSAEGRVIHVEQIQARPERLGELERPLPASVRAKLGDDRLWEHQARAIDLVRQGESVVVATGTASGKSRCFQLPIAEATIDPVKPGTALLLFPTKALGHDQLRALTAYSFEGIIAGAYDGDASQPERTWIRANANVVLTNPEMLHAGLLPRHEKWAPLLMRLRYVVIDELHTLRGVFGAHVAHILRRLRRLCAHYGADPTFIFTSATIGQPERLATSLCAKPVTAITVDGSPQGHRRFALLDPPVIDSARGTRTSASSEAAAVSADLIRAGHRTITFCRSRKATELVAADIDRRIRKQLPSAIRSYRGGYLPSERRDIEDELANGSLRGVVATSALELGVDIGDLDACVMTGFPGTVASMWQQAGRAGRRNHESVTVLVAGDDQLDRWLMNHPTQVFSRSPEPAVINTANPYILHPHLACAAYELPLDHGDQRWWTPDELHDGVRDLVRSDSLRLSRQYRFGRPEPVAYWRGSGYPARSINLRSSGDGTYKIIEASTDRLVGTVDGSSASNTVHCGAVYLHRGQPYDVIELDAVNRVARVIEADGSTYTQPRSSTDIAVINTEQQRSVGRAELRLGTVEVLESVEGYQRRETRTRKLLSNELLDLPAQRLVTRAFWYTFPPELLHDAGITAENGPGALHAAEHGAIGLLPLFTICDRSDVGGVSTAMHRDTNQATIFIYDGVPGGAGIAELGWEAGRRHLQATVDLIKDCECSAGCPSCVQSPKCGNGNEPLDKVAAISLLEAVLD